MQTIKKSNALILEIKDDLLYIKTACDPNAVRPLVPLSLLMLFSLV